MTWLQFSLTLLWIAACVEVSMRLRTKELRTLVGLALGDPAAFGRLQREWAEHRSVIETVRGLVQAHEGRLGALEAWRHGVDELPVVRASRGVGQNPPVPRTGEGP